MENLSTFGLAGQYYLDAKRIAAIGDSFAEMSEDQKHALSQMTVRRINDTRVAALRVINSGEAQSFSEAWEQASLFLPN